MKLPKPVHVDRGVYTMAMDDGETAEITMYGEIVEERPVDWWTGQPTNGDYIVRGEFLRDLESVSSVKALTIRMDSVGGDAGVSILIHNRLRELADKGTKLTCIVDGVAMSGGSLIMCACNDVRVNPSSLVMIHKCWGILWGGYNADELRKAAKDCDAWDKAQVSIYQRKTGLSNTVLSHMMSETTYMTGVEAVEKGFANTLLEDAEPLSIAASADGRSLLVRGRTFHLTPGMFAPDTIPTTTSPPESTGIQNGGITMATTLEELRQENPKLAEQLLAEARAAVSASGEPGLILCGTEAEAKELSEQRIAVLKASEAEKAAEAERKRIQDIDAVAALYDAETVREAKYGEHPCTAQEMVYAAAQRAAQKGKQALADMELDTKASGVQEVPSVSDAGGGGDSDSPQMVAAQAKADVATFQKLKEVR